MEEQWYDIPNWEGLYQITKSGKVRNLDRCIIDFMGRRHYFKGKEIKININNSGYACCHFSRNCKRKIMFIHRMIAELFVSNPENFSEVNHKDGNKMNNSIENLEWVTRSDNIKHAIYTGLRKRSYSTKEHLDRIRKNSLEKHRRPLRVLNMTTGEEKDFYYFKQASAFIGVNSHSLRTALKKSDVYKNYKITELKKSI